MDEPKKETVRIAPPPPEQAATAAAVAKHDTVRIVLPARTPVPPIRRLPPKITPLASSQPTESARELPGLLPRRPPAVTPASAASPLLEPLPKPPGIETAAERGAAVRPVPTIREENNSAKPVDRGPKKDTARISILPRPAAAAAPAINLTKTQPLLIHPAGSTPAAPAVITSRPLAPRDAIPRSLAWTVFAVAAVIFLIQIWNYVVS
jgi:hypothetical protein